MQVRLAPSSASLAVYARLRVTVTRCGLAASWLLSTHSWPPLAKLSSTPPSAVSSLQLS